MRRYNKHTTNAKKFILLLLLIFIIFLLSLSCREEFVSPQFESEPITFTVDSLNGEWKFHKVWKEYVGYIYGCDETSDRTYTNINLSIDFYNTNCNTLNLYDSCVNIVHKKYVEFIGNRLISKSCEGMNSDGTSFMIADYEYGVDSTLLVLKLNAGLNSLLPDGAYYYLYKQNN